MGREGGKIKGFIHVSLSKSDFKEKLDKTCSGITEVLANYIRLFTLSIMSEVKGDDLHDWGQLSKLDSC